MRHRNKSMERGVYHEYSKKMKRLVTFVQVRVYCKNDAEAEDLRNRLYTATNLWILDQKEAENAAQTPE